MAEQTAPLAATIDAFEHARGDERDAAWAQRVSWTLLLRDVDAALVDEGLREALDVVRQSGEPPAVLFGTADEHAVSLHDEWLAEGRLGLARPAPMSWATAVRVGLGMSAAYAFLLALVQLVRDDLDAASAARLGLISLAIGLGAALGASAWGRRHRPRASVVDAPTDLRWSVELTEFLRTRHSMSAARVRDVVAEAHAHAAASGSTLEDEFGTPEEYAARFAPDLARRSRWKLGAFVAMACVSGILFLDRFAWSSGGATAIWVWWAVEEHRQLRRLSSTAL